jgi:hypothetical protein
MLTRVVENGRAWVECTEGFKVQFSMWNGNDSSLTYTEGGREIALEAIYWHDSNEDREADLSKMSDRQLTKYFERTVMLIYVPDALRWRDGGEVISSEDRARILANIRSACEFENNKPRFLRQPCGRQS